MVARCAFSSPCAGSSMMVSLADCVVPEISPILRQQSREQENHFSLKDGFTSWSELGLPECRLCSLLGEVPTIQRQSDRNVKQHAPHQYHQKRPRWTPTLLLCQLTRFRSICKQLVILWTFLLFKEEIEESQSVDRTRDLFDLNNHFYSSLWPLIHDEMAVSRGQKYTDALLISYRVSAVY